MHLFLQKLIKKILRCLELSGLILSLMRKLCILSYYCNNTNDFRDFVCCLNHKTIPSYTCILFFLFRFNNVKVSCIMTFRIKLCV